MIKNSAVFMMFLFLVVISGCGSIAKSSYLTDRPVVFYPQTIITQEDDEVVRSKSIKALMESLATYNWEIHGLDTDKGKIVAEACRRGQHCMEVEATIKDNGAIEIIRTPGQTLTKNEGIVLKRWLRILRNAYNAKMNPKPETDIKANKEETENKS